jgi:hypothetical protein
MVSTAFAALTACAVAFARGVESGAIPLLQPERGAEWILAPQPVNLATHTPRRARTLFRARFRLEVAPASAPLMVRAFRTGSIAVNGTPIGDEGRGSGHLTEFSLDVARFLRSGENEVVIGVRNPTGPPALLAYSTALGLRSGPSWETRRRQEPWQPAVPADPPGRAPGSESQSSWRELARLWPFAAILFAGGCASNWLRERRRGPLGDAAVPIFRWAVLAILATLYASNFARLPREAGMDFADQMAYVDFVRSNRAPPLPNQGWLFHQAPLAYILGALASSSLPGLDPPLVLRALTMVCGLATAWAVSRTCAVAFPGEPVLQLVAIGVGLTLPMGVYLNQVFGNEPFFALFGTLALWATLRLLRDDSPSAATRASLTVGVLMGLAVLAKATGWILLAPLLGATALAAYRRTRSLRVLAADVGAALAAVLAVSGWYYVRNLLAFGGAYAWGMYHGVGIEWWQHPGYRVWGDFLRFGEAIGHPIFATFAGFWNGIYSTIWTDGSLSTFTAGAGLPWHEGPMLALAVLALPLTLALLAGMVVGFASSRSGPADDAVALSAAAVLAFVLAMLMIHAQSARYSSAKGSYALALTSCLAILAARGMRPILASPLGRSLVAGYLAMWTGFVVSAFAVV